MSVVNDNSNDADGVGGFRQRRSPLLSLENYSRRYYRDSEMKIFSVNKTQRASSRGRSVAVFTRGEIRDNTGYQHHDAARATIKAHRYSMLDT